MSKHILLNSKKKKMLINQNNNGRECNLNHKFILFVDPPNIDQFVYQIKIIRISTWRIIKM